MQNYPKLNFRQKLFFRIFCYPPPGRNIGTENSLSQKEESLSILVHYFGDYFLKSLKGKIVLDVGCGEGNQVIGAALYGAKLAIGAEIRPVFKKALNWAEEARLIDKIIFTLKDIKEFGEGSVDVAFSLNSFEHFLNPDKILCDVFYVLKKGGIFFITFGPPWLHPWGGHMSFMMKYPWTHILFSEQTIMTVRRFYKNDGADKIERVEGGLNKMTIKKFKKCIENSDFELEKLTLIPIKGIRPLIKIPFIREFFTSNISAILKKP